mmetsp:Transcript_44557/g.74326  ORF Transcript_44557/g.74326 Transcript_44557/m.74326 type:complete len:296 (-) Transcript_44557:173-1060(-)
MTSYGNVDYVGEGEAPPSSIEDGTYHSKAYVDNHVASLLRDANKKRLTLEDFKKKRSKEFEEMFGSAADEEKKRKEYRKMLDAEREAKLSGKKDKKDKKKSKKKKKKKKKKAERKISNFFHASDTTPCYEDELDIDSDDEYEVDDEWLREQQKQSIEELEELSQSEQLFAIQWNDFVHKHHVYADFVFPLMCEIFANEHGKWLIEKRLRTNFLLHLMTMWEWRLVSSRTIQKCMLIVDSSGADIVAPAKDLNAFVKDVSSSTSSSTSSSSLSKKKKEERTANRPKVTRSRAEATR